MNASESPAGRADAHDRFVPHPTPQPDRARWVALGPTRVLVEPGVFPPQQDTLAVIDWSDALLRRGVRRPLIVDLCTGSGIIALALAGRHRDARIYAVDNSDAAVRSARTNADRWKRRTGMRIEVRAGDATDPGTLADIAGSADLVVANPPYLPDALPAPTGLADTDPAALHGGRDGLDVIRGVVAVGAATLRAGGWLVLEHAAGQQEVVMALLDGSGRFDSVTGHRDHAAIPRFVTACRRHPSAPAPAAREHDL